MDLQKIIREYKMKTGYTDGAIAKKLGIARSTVMRWSKGDVKNLSSEMTAKLSELFGYDIRPLLSDYDCSFSLPILGYAKAGYDMFLEENYIGREESSLEERKSADYYLKIEGNSMIGVGIMPGSLVLVRQTDQIESGRIGVVQVGDEVTVKRVIYKDKMIILEAANPEVDTRYYTKKEASELPVRIIGQVVSCKTYL